MKYIRATASFYRYADDKLIVTAAHIIQCIQKQALFNNPDPPLKDLQSAYQDYRLKVVEARGKGRIEAALKRESKRALSDLLQRLAFYINMTCDGNLAKLYSSGFPVLAGKRKGRSPDTPSAPYVQDGRRSGEVAFGFRPVGRDMVYEYRFATVTDSSGMPIWAEIYTTSRSFRAYKDGFTPGQFIYFQVRARNRHGHSHWTSPILFMVR